MLKRRSSPKNWKLSWDFVRDQLFGSFVLGLLYCFVFCFFPGSVTFLRFFLNLCGTGHQTVISSWPVVRRSLTFGTRRWSLPSGCSLPLYRPRHEKHGWFLNQFVGWTSAPRTLEPFPNSNQWGHMSHMPNLVVSMLASRWQASLVVDGSKHEIFSVDRKGFPVKALGGGTTIFFWTHVKWSKPVIIDQW